MRHPPAPHDQRRFPASCAAALCVAPRRWRSPRRPSRCRTATDRSSSPCSETSARVIGHSARSAPRWPTLRARLPLRAGDHRRRQHLRVASGRRTMQQKFEEPYKALLDAGVKFYASLGNHDDRAQQQLQALQHGRAGPTTRSRRRHEDVRFFALESDLPRSQADRLARRRSWRARARSGRFRTSTIRCIRRDGTHGSHAELRAVLEPLFVAVRRQRRLHRPRSLLRAHQAAERHRAFRGGIGREAAAGGHRPQDAA